MLASHSFTAYDEVAVLFAVSTGDQKAFAALFSRYKDRVYTIALTYTENSTIAEEIVQDVFMRVWKNRPKLKEINNFSSWIHVITRNRALTELQKIAREGERKEELISYLPTEVSDAEDKVQVNHMEELLEKALTRLSPQQRKVFVLTRLQGHTRMEVAEMLNLAPATVSVHLAIALRSIRAFLTNQLELTALLFFFLFF
ncbi:RNA polymerase sigma-70 factor [Flavitalea sp. BT771]|uniref:RNA polymerase sigma factor n=1 Tax=Flavitalea sp. BT771 TaxID=3063329 RepID=UPI0026E235E1|nr:RNA polymerase sigma-70 factor [Flavitalea sp. BT771]MDO6429932.1 RNA polymerase sigma-70 factor [Flavitalea sp. BT771]MDV6217940.1 RNA polymerase sigma-70 factor [Flavitalea sp. BT771]